MPRCPSLGVTAGPTQAATPAMNQTYPVIRLVPTSVDTPTIMNITGM